MKEPQRNKHLRTIIGATAAAFAILVSFAIKHSESVENFLFRHSAVHAVERALNPDNDNTRGTIHFSTPPELPSVRGISADALLKGSGTNRFVGGHTRCSDLEVGSIERIHCEAGK